MTDTNKDAAAIVKSFPKILKEYYFVSWGEVGHVRTHVRGDELAECFAEFDPKEEITLQSMFDLYQMVNDKGMSKEECESLNIEFASHCQKAVWMFGEEYEITQEKFQNNAKCSDDYETYQVLPLSKTSTDEEGFEEDPLTKDIQNVVFSTCHFNDFEKVKISDLASEINEIYQSKGGKKVFPFNGIWDNFSTICVNLVKRGLKEISESEEGHDKFLKEVADQIDNSFKE